MSAVVVAISDTILRKSLEDEAARDRDYMPAVLYQVAHESHTRETLVLAWEDFRDAVRARNALAGGTAHPADYYEYGTTRDHAVDLKCAEVDDAFNVIMRGGRL